MFDQAKDIDVGYAAGVFEGEGSVVIRDERNVRLTIVSTDRDVLERVTEIVGHGTINRLRHAGPHNKECWQWYINRKELVMQFIDKMMPLMGQRRQKRMTEAVQVLSVMKTRRCVQCNRKFPTRHGKLCSDKCRLEHRRAYHRAYYAENGR